MKSTKREDRLAKNRRFRRALKNGLDVGPKITGRRVGNHRHGAGIGRLRGSCDHDGEATRPSSKRRRTKTSKERVTTMWSRVRSLSFGDQKCTDVKKADSAKTFLENHPLRKRG